MLKPLVVAVFQVVQQQQLLQNNESSVLYNPETQTKIIYRVVYPSDIHRGGRSTHPVGRSRKRLHRSLEVTHTEQDGTPRPKSAKKLRHRRTRSGRVCRPPQYMVKDYRQIATVDFEVETNGNAAGTSYLESSGEEEVGDVSEQKKPGGAFDFDESIPVGEEKHLNTVNNHRRMVTQHCINGDWLSQWRMPKFDPCRTETP